MNRYAIIEAGVVANVARAAEPLGENWIELDPGSAVGPGWLYDGEAFAAPEAPAPSIPSVVSRKQARMALVLSGVPLAAVQSAIDAIVDDTERALAQIAWDDAVEFRRDDPFLVAMATALSLTESQLDDLYTLAATL